MLAGCSGEGDVKLSAVSVPICLLSQLLLAGEDDLRDVRSAVADLAGEWMNLGISLGVRKSGLDPVQSANPHSSSNCLREMLTLWLRQSCNVSTTFIFHLPHLVHKFTQERSCLKTSLIHVKMKFLAQD